MKPTYARFYTRKYPLVSREVMITYAPTVNRTYHVDQSRMNNASISCVSCSLWSIEMIDRNDLQSSKSQLPMSKEQTDITNDTRYPRTYPMQNTRGNFKISAIP